MYYIISKMFYRVIFMDRKMIDRINELAKKKKTVGLTEAETAEQKELYKVYLAEIRGQFTETLENVSIKEADGSVTPLKKK